RPVVAAMSHAAEHLAGGHHHWRSQATRREWEIVSHRFVWEHEHALIVRGSARKVRRRGRSPLAHMLHVPYRAPKASRKRVTSARPTCGAPREARWCEGGN